MMGPNLLKSSDYYMSEANSAEPVQIISKTGVQLEPLYPKQQPKSVKQHQHKIVWRNVIIFMYLHGFGLYGLYLILNGSCQWKTVVWTYLVGLLASQGITAGAHRLWAHRTYKARLPLRIYLAFCQTVALQNHIYEWVRDHRVHHKFTDTDADPHNAQRGFFFSHMGWLLVKKHKDVFIKGKTVDMSDVYEDPVVRFQMKFYILLAPILCFLFPAFVPWYFWNEQLYISWNVAAVFRYIISLNFTWLVNSAAHIWGTKPYDKNIGPTENIAVAFLAYGEGWHNYHHVFPWDYKAAELGNYRLNLTTGFIDLMAKLGQAYDLKTVPVHMINKRVKRTGDGTREDEDTTEDGQNAEDRHHHIHDADMIWGWGDKDMQEEHMNLVQIYHKKDL